MDFQMQGMAVEWNIDESILNQEIPKHKY